MATIGLALAVLAAGWALWVFGGLGDRIVAGACGAAAPIFPDVERYLSFDDCATRVESRAILIGSLFTGVVVGWLIRAGLRREAREDLR